MNDATSDKDTPSEGTPKERALALRQQHHVPLAKYAFTLGADRHQANAIAEDAVLALAFTDPGTVDRESGWLYTYVRRAVAKIHRAASARHEIATDMAALADTAEQTSVSSPELRLEALDTLRALQALPEIYRESVTLAAAGLSDAEIAAALGVSINTAAQRVSRGRKRLAALTGRPRTSRTPSTPRSLSTLRTIEEGRTE